jgi:ATP-binding cassette, subfamily B, bacterial
MREILRGFRFLIWSSFRANPRIAFFGLALEPIGATLGATSALFVRWIIDGATSGVSASVVRGAIGLVAVSAVAGVLGFIGWPLRTRLLEETGSWLDARTLEMQGNIPGLEHTERPEYFDRLQSVNGNDLAFSIILLVGTLGSMGRIAFGIGLLGSVDSLLMLLPLFGLPSVLMGGRISRILDSAWTRSRPLWHRADSIYALHISPGPAKELRVFNLENETRRVHDEARVEGARILTRASLRASAIQAIGWTIFAAGYTGALGLVALRVSQGQATLGDLVLAITISAQMNASVGDVVESIQGLAGRLRNAEHFLWLEDQAKAAKVAATSKAPDTLRDGIRLESVSFQYPGTDDTVLSAVDVFLPAGSRVAIVGDNGAGKTTLVKLLAGFYRPTQGRITVDSIDLQSIDPEEWRTKLSAGFQDYCRFEFQAASTVGIGDLEHLNETSAIERALQRAGAEEVAGKLVNGLSTQLGKSFDDGVDLSMGQWQKLALGRAFMRDAPLLTILDEPTSSLDAPTEHALFSRYAAVAEERRGLGCITLLVSHRFSTVLTADLILVIEGGRIAEQGTHDQLIAAGGLYAELFTLQASAYR